jgi:hypothetical protein
MTTLTETRKMTVTTAERSAVVTMYVVPDSSCIDAIGFSKKLGLVVCIRGRLYVYPQVKTGLYKKFHAATSKGRFYVNEVRKSFVGVRAN